MRNLEREIAKTARKSLTKIVKREAEAVTVTPDNLDEFLGVPKYRFGLAEKEDQVGVVTGLAYTSVGGDLLHIEALRLPGKGRMKTTGKLGDVMKESHRRGVQLRAVHRARDRGETAAVRKGRHPRARAGWGHAQGRAVGRSGDGDVDRLGADRYSGAQGHRHDRRGQRCAATRCPLAG